MLWPIGTAIFVIECRKVENEKEDREDDEDDDDEGGGGGGGGGKRKEGSRSGRGSEREKRILEGKKKKECLRGIDNAICSNCCSKRYGKS